MSELAYCFAGSSPVKGIQLIMYGVFTMDRVKRSWDEVADELLQKDTTDVLWRIQIDGEYIITSSGVCFWKKLSHARNALRFEFESCLRKESLDISKDENISFTDAIQKAENEYQKFINERVCFVESVI